MATRRKILFDEFSTLLTDDSFGGRWLTDRELLFRILLNVNAEAKSAYTYGELNKAISSRYPFVNDRHQISGTILLIMIKKMFKTQLEDGRWSANFYYINNTAVPDDIIGLKRKGIEWREIYSASGDSMLTAPQRPPPPPQQQPRRKRKQHPATMMVTT